MCIIKGDKTIHCLFAGFQLGEYIADFSPLVYDPIEVDERHSITKRSLYDKGISLQLKHGDRLVEPATEKSDGDLIVFTQFVVRALRIVLC